MFGGFQTLEQTDKSFLVERCKSQRLFDNENSLKNSPSSEDITDSDATSQVKMTQQNLITINYETFSSLDKARTAILDLSINRISEISNATFDSFTNLRILRMHINNMARINGSTFGDLMMLEELILAQNMISDIERDSFSSMKNLHTIDLSANCMFHLPNYIFFRNVHLINIYLNLNHLSTMPLIFPASQNVVNFNATGNHFTNLTAFIRYRNIESLDLSGNPLSADEMRMNIVAASVSSESSSETSDENGDYNYFNTRYATGRKYIYNPTISTREPPPKRNIFNHDGGIGRYSDDRIDFLPDLDFMSETRTRTNILKSEYSLDDNGNSHNSDVQYLMDTFRPNRISEEALESLIKTAMTNMTEAFKVVDMIEIFSVITNFYRSQNHLELNNEMRKLINERKLDVASFVQHLRDVTRMRIVRQSSLNEILSPDELQQHRTNVQTNHLEYFTCRNCSLHSFNFLVKFPELKYVDVSCNKLKSIDEMIPSQMPYMRYLLASDNEINSLNFTSLIHNWPEFRVLLLNDNIDFRCDLVQEMQYKVAHLNRMFKLEVNKCK